MISILLCVPLLMTMAAAQTAPPGSQGSVLWRRETGG